MSPILLLVVTGFHTPITVLTTVFLGSLGSGRAPALLQIASPKKQSATAESQEKENQGLFSSNAFRAFLTPPCHPTPAVGIVYLTTHAVWPRAKAPYNLS